MAAGIEWAQFPWVWVAIGLAVAVTAIIVWARRAAQSAKELDLSEELGFAYDPGQDIFYSTMDAWQRQFGYCRLYDEAAAPLGMIIDSEPVRFSYDGREWLIELWKGQYGMTTGAEIGVYSSDGPDLAIPGVFDGTFYEDTSQLLQMSLELYKNGTRLFQRQERHWWLTGFVLGEFSQPEELELRARLYLRDPGMLQAFAAALREIGYTDKEIIYSGTSLYISYRTPHTAQPLTRTEEGDRLIQANNRRLCRAFEEAVGAAGDAVSRLERLRKDNPALYKKLVQATRASEALYKPYKVIRKHLGVSR